MKHTAKISTIVFLLISLTTIAQQQRSFKFDFGTIKATPGYIPITGNSRYLESKGYGFTNHSEVKEVSRGDKKNIASDYLTSNQPFYFSVKLPEGNYDVRILLGDIKGTSATTVRAECRRLFLQNIITPKGQIKTESFKGTYKMPPGAQVATIKIYGKCGALYFQAGEYPEMKLLSTKYDAFE